MGNIGSVQYASLSPGHYVFKARGATSDGVMNEEAGDEVTHRSFILRFWKTWWFFQLDADFHFLALVMAWYRYRLNEVLKTEKLRNRNLLLICMMKSVRH